MSIRYATANERERMALEERVDAENRCPHCRQAFLTADERNAHADRCPLSPGYYERRRAQ